jgi:AcrR family transcriptional regulator
MAKKQISSKERLINSGALLFAEKGFDGVSVRAICAHAETSMNMIHHYFESKEGLLTVILENFTTEAFVTPLKIIEDSPKSSEDFRLRMEMLFESTLETYIKNRNVVVISNQVQLVMPVLMAYQEKFSDFLNRSKKLGFVRESLDSEMIAGFMLDRINNQVQYAPWINKAYKIDLLKDVEYRKRWCKSNLDLFLNGITTR